MKTNFNLMRAMAAQIVDTVEVKDRDYGSSWRRRGGPGAFMVMARKWDRIENLVQQDGWDIFKSIETDRGGIKDDVRDLMGYLLLILEATDTAHRLEQGQQVSLEGDGGNPLPQLHPASRGYSAPIPEDSMFESEGIYGDGSVLYTCRVCRGKVTALGLQDAHEIHDCPGPPAVPVKHPDGP